MDSPVRSLTSDPVEAACEITTKPSNDCPGALENKNRDLLPASASPSAGRSTSSPIDADPPRSSSESDSERDKTVPTETKPEEKAASSALERLPTELLQIICLFSKNVHPRECSRTLCAALSSKHMFFCLSVAAFKPKLDYSAEDLRVMNDLLRRRGMTKGMWHKTTQYLRKAVRGGRGPLNDPNGRPTGYKYFGRKLEASLLVQPFTSERWRRFKAECPAGAFIYWPATNAKQPRYCKVRPSVPELSELEIAELEQWEGKPPEPDTWSFFAPSVTTEGHSQAWICRRLPAS